MCRRCDPIVDRIRAAILLATRNGLNLYATFRESPRAAQLGTDGLLATEVIGVYCGCIIRLAHQAAQKFGACTGALWGVSSPSLTGCISGPCTGRSAELGGARLAENASKGLAAGILMVVGERVRAEGLSGTPRAVRIVVQAFCRAIGEVAHDASAVVCPRCEIEAAARVITRELGDSCHCDDEASAPKARPEVLN